MFFERIGIEASGHKRTRSALRTRQPRSAVYGAHYLLCKTLLRLAGNKRTGRKFLFPLVYFLIVKECQHAHYLSRIGIGNIIEVLVHFVRTRFIGVEPNRSEERRVG